MPQVVVLLVWVINEMLWACAQPRLKTKTQ